MEKQKAAVKNTDTSLVKPLEGNSEMTFNSKKFAIAVVLVIILGIGTGYLLRTFSGKLSSVKQGLSLERSGSEKGTVVGSKDNSIFKDSTEGLLKEGGIDGEGQFHLERPGGESQNVYLTSSVIDLSSFTGRKVKVWGQTFSGKKAGWLMDVGRLEILE